MARPFWLGHCGPNLRLSGSSDVATKRPIAKVWNTVDFAGRLRYKATHFLLISDVRWTACAAGIPNEHGPPNVHSGSDQSDALERVLGANLDREQTRSASVSEHLVETRSPRATGAGQVEDSNESQSTGVTLGTDRSTIHSLHTTACEFSSPRYSRLGEASGSDANSFGDENSTTGKGASAHTATDTSRTARDDPVERLARVIRDGDLPVGRCVQ